MSKLKLTVIMSGSSSLHFFLCSMLFGMLAWYGAAGQLHHVVVQAHTIEDHVLCHDTVIRLALMGTKSSPKILKFPQDFRANFLPSKIPADFYENEKLKRKWPKSIFFRVFSIFREIRESVS